MFDVNKPVSPPNSDRLPEIRSGEVGGERHLNARKILAYPEGR